jgi:hypothetical protein
MAAQKAHHQHSSTLLGIFLITESGYEITVPFRCYSVIEQTLLCMSSFSLLPTPVLK